jgi:cyclase
VPREQVLQAGLEATKVVTDPDNYNLVLRRPELTSFSDRVTLHLPEFLVELRHVGRPAHTTNDVLVWLPEQRGALRR